MSTRNRWKLVKTKTFPTKREARAYGDAIKLRAIGTVRVRVYPMRLMERKKSKDNYRVWVEVLKRQY